MVAAEDAARDAGQGRTAGSTVWRALLVFTAAGIVLALLLATMMVLVVNRADRQQALTRADRIARTLASEVVGPRFDSEDPQRHEVLNELLGSRAEDGSVVRIKIWTPDGQVIWADERRLIGRRYELAPQDQALVGTQDAYATLTDLSKPENEFEEELDGTFIEVYAGFFDRVGRPLVFEAYLPADELGGGVLRGDLVGLALGWLVLLLAVLLPLAASLARRVDRAQAEQQRLLRHAVEASELERRRLAQDLHDGVIQDLAGLGYVFSGLEAQLGEQPTALTMARRAGDMVRRDVLALRSLSTDLYPPDLGGDGLEAAVLELLDTCQQQGLCAALQVGEPLDLPTRTALVAYRVVREGLRNVVKHAGASKVTVALERADGHLAVRVEDDGRGFDTGHPAPAGHLGLRVLRDSVTDVGGQVELCSAPGSGTVLSASLPVR